MPRTLSPWLPVFLLTLVALGLRCRDLGARPMHADEANQAVKAGELVESGRYAYDPRDHHGPTLYYGALLAAWCRGEGTLASLDEVTVRLVPALAGTCSVVLLYLLAIPLGRPAALAAAAFLAVSPPAVYYSRFFIQETLLVTFTLAAFVSARRWWSTGRVRWALAAGAGVGLMQATKENAPLFVAAGLVALLFGRPRQGAPASPLRAALAGVGAALLVAALFYSSFGTHLSGLRDAFAAYGDMARRLQPGDTGHEKPWWYFLQLFSWRQSGGLAFQQVGFLVLVLGGAATAIAAGPPFSRWAAAYSGLVLLALSATAYKTPWHSIHLVPGFSLLAAGGLAAAARGTAGRILATVAAVLVLGLQAAQADRVSRVYASDARNPYAYVHSSPDVLKFRPLAVAALARSPGGAVRVISEEYWPLPWYLRGLDRVGYWTEAPATCDAALVIASAGQADTVRSRLHGRYRESYLGLRPGFVCIVFQPEP